MAAKNSKSPKTQNMIENFMTYVKKGYTLPQIAEYFEVCLDTVKKYLDEIAALNNITKKELTKKIRHNQLAIIHKSPNVHKAADKVNEYYSTLKSLSQEFESASEDLSITLSKLNSKLSDLSDINFLISETEDLVKSIKDKLNKPQKVSIEISSYGKFHIYPKNFHIDISDADYYLNKLLSYDDDLKNISDKHKMTLAKALSISNKLKSEEIDYEISFETKKLGKLFVDLKRYFSYN